MSSQCNLMHNRLSNNQTQKLLKQRGVISVISRCFMLFKQIFNSLQSLMVGVYLRFWGVCATLQHEVTSFWLGTTHGESPNSNQFLGLCIHVCACLSVCVCLMLMSWPSSWRLLIPRNKQWVVLCFKQWQLLEETVLQGGRNKTLPQCCSSKRPQSGS